MATAIARSEWTGTKGLANAGLPNEWGEAEKWLEKNTSSSISNSKELTQADFFDEFTDWAELQFGLAAGAVEEGIRFGFSSLNGEEIWERPLFILASQVGDSLGLNKDRVKEELQRLLVTWESVRWCQARR